MKRGWCCVLGEVGRSTREEDHNANGFRDLRDQGKVRVTGALGCAQCRERGLHALERGGD